MGTDRATENVRLVIRITALLLVLFTRSESAHSVQLYATDFETGPAPQLYSVDPTSGHATHLSTTPFTYLGLDYRKNGMLYGAFADLVTINPTTGETALVGDGSVPELLGGIAFSPDDRLFAISSHGTALYQINPNTGSVLGGAFVSGALNIGGIDFAPDGTLYGVGEALYILNPTTGAATRVNPGDSLYSEPMQSLDYGPDGILRAYSLSTVSKLYTIDQTTGAASLVGPSTLLPPGIHIGALASAPVPVPPAVLLLGSSIIALFVTSARRRSA